MILVTLYCLMGYQWGAIMMFGFPEMSLLRGVTHGALWPISLAVWGYRNLSR